MDEFISMVTDKLGVGEKESRAATGGILGMLKGKLDDSMFGSIIEKIPGADALLGEAEAAPQEEAGGGGLMGSLSSMAGGLMGGGKAGGAAEVAGLLGSTKERTPIPAAHSGGATGTWLVILAWRKLAAG